MIFDLTNFIFNFKKEPAAGLQLYPQVLWGPVAHEHAAGNDDEDDDDYEDDDGGDNDDNDGDHNDDDNEDGGDGVDDDYDDDLKARRKKERKDSLWWTADSNLPSTETWKNIKINTNTNIKF